MCGTCEQDHRRWWTSTNAFTFALVSLLLILSVTGLVMRVRSSERRAADRCEAAASAAVRFQSAVTRDVDRPGFLRSDTAAFVDELHALGATGCPKTRPFLSSAENTLRDLCPRCASDLHRVRVTAARSGPLAVAFPE